jgi:hypothetical protein
MRKFVFLFVYGIFSVFDLAAMPVDSIQAQDTLQAKPKHKIIPRVATIRSLIFPGLGQAYNRQYWKLPLVAGAFVSLGLIANYNHVRYHKYRSFYYIVSPRPQEPSYVPPRTVSVVYEDGLARDLDANQLKRLNDGFRRNRDYTYIGMFVAWAFNVVDANVSAHLKTFDLSDDISLQVKPILDFDPLSKGMVSSLTLSFNFKK